MTDDLDELVKALDTQSPDWWIRFGGEQFWRDMAYEAKHKDYERMNRIIDSRKRSLAGDLTVVIRAAIEAGQVKLP